MIDQEKIRKSVESKNSGPYGIFPTKKLKFFKFNSDDANRTRTYYEIARWVIGLGIAIGMVFATIFLIYTFFAESSAFVEKKANQPEEVKPSAQHVEIIIAPPKQPAKPAN